LSLSCWQNSHENQDSFLTDLDFPDPTTYFVIINEEKENCFDEQSAAENVKQKFITSGSSHKFINKPFLDFYNESNRKINKLSKMMLTKSYVFREKGIKKRFSQH